ncbi:MAG: LPS-assembly protein LptD [Verrucomicrobia bacterium]|nr:LPS-assembly protein LptD [Verrucomicrobiota bacterium]
MTRCRFILFVASLLATSLACFGQALPKPELHLDAEGGFEIDKTGKFNATNGTVRYEQAVLVADRISGDQTTGDVFAEGHVRLMHGELIWVSESIHYNYLTKKMEASQFRTGKSPVFTEGESLGAESKDKKEPDNNPTNKIYTAKNSYFTTDDNAEPFEKIRARSITIIPGDDARIIARDATLYLGKMPVFYFPYYSRRLDPHANHFDFVPGYRSRYGAYLLSSYNWYLDRHIDGILHLDYRTQRGVGGGPDLNLHMDRWGDASFKYYYLNDQTPGSVSNAVNLPHNRQRFEFGYNSTPWTNLNLKARVSYEGDERVLHDFFEGDFRANPQSSTFVEATRHWDNFSLDAYAQPRVNSFFETVERLPDVRLTGFRQQLGDSPLFYESETSAGWYRRLFAETNNVASGLDYEAARADTYHQLTLPKTYFGWLNFTPRVGGRFSYYGNDSGPGGTNSEIQRGIFNTGAEVSFKASRLWSGTTNRLLALDGLRHIVEPSVNYVYVPAPQRGPSGVPKFDYELPSLRLLPVEFPDYNAIDSIDSQNVMRLGLRNRLQTKRDGQIENLVYWDLYTDWRMDRHDGQSTFADVYSDLVFRPRTWLTLESQTRYDSESGRFNMSFHNLTIQPNDRWSWGIGHWYLRDDLSGSPLALGRGNDLFTSTIFYRLDENWGFRLHHQFEARDGTLEEQDYTIYRDMRSWTAALTLRKRDHRDGKDDYTVAFTFSLKASPRFGLGGDTVKPARLLGY